MALIGANGGLIGSRRSSDLFTAPGLWTANEQVLLRRAATWPVTGDLFFANTSLLLHMDGTNGSTTFTDSSSNALTLTVNGNAQISTAQSKFGGASGYFDGSGDYVSIPSNTALVFSGDFTIECWIYCSSVSSNKGIVASSGERFGLIRLGSNLYWLGSGDINGTVVSLQTNTWTHVVACRSGSTLRLFVDGVLTGSGTSTQTPASNTWYVGSNQSNETFDGYIDDLRITNGVARYTANFTPPTSAFPNSQNTSVDPNFANVSLLLHMDGSNGSTTFTDNSSNAFTLTPSGNAQISTTQSKFGGASGLFDGTGDYLTLSPGSRFALGATSFTVEMWLRLNTAPGTNFLVDARNSGQTSNWTLLFNGGGLEWFDGPTSTTRTWSPSINTWYHIAFVRNGSTCQFYIDGTALGASFTNTTNLSTEPTTSYIGGRYTQVDFFNGYIDELRITKGVARYIANFTPPTAAFPNS